MARISVACLAVGAAVFGAPAASAQGSMDALGDLPGTIADLQLANQALNGPVSVTANAEGGPTVTYSNETDIIQRCSGFTMPYATVADNDIDPGALAEADLGELSAIAQVIAGAGGVSILNTVDGEPNSFDSGDFDIIFTLNNLITKTDSRNTGNLLEPGESVTWTATAPAEPSAVAIMCTPDADRSVANTEFYFGVDKRVVADQINDVLGPLGSVGTGSISGGSVELGATALAPLGSIGAAGSGGDDTSEGAE